jgi:hypothetical protein
MVAVLLTIFAIQVIGGMWNNAATYDEVAHLPAGYAYIKKADFRFNPEHPPLVKMMAALPLLSMKIPALEKNPYWDSKNEWQFGRYFLFHSGIDADKALFHARLMMLLLALLLAVVVFQWSKALYGETAAVFSLFLFAFEPNLIGNAQVIHTDLGFSLFMTSSLFFLWKAMRSRSKVTFVYAGLCFGFSLATKFTALVLFPIFLLFILLYFFEKNSSSSRAKLIRKQEDAFSFKERFRFLLIHLPILLIVAVFTLTAIYCFSSLDRYFDGLKFVLDHNEKGNPSFLFGMYSDFGWWYYFPLAFLIKTPLPLILFFSLSLFFFFKASLSILWRKNSDQVVKENQSSESKLRLYSELYLLLPVFLFFFLSLFSKINIGIRHILPVYPLIIIFSGRYLHDLYRSARGSSKKSWRVLTLTLIVWLAASSIFIFPYHLSYFNELILGPKRGYKYLADSNLDWGQDLIRLKKFLDKEGEESLIFSYCGSADPHYYGIKYQYLPGFGLNYPQNYQIQYNRKEFIAVSATNLQSVFFNLHDTYDWLKARKPYTRIGYSIFVWEISQDASSHENLARIYREFGFDTLSSKHLLRAQKVLNLSSLEKE